MGSPGELSKNSSDEADRRGLALACYAFNPDLRAAET
jgi:hypothetical protein